MEELLELRQHILEQRYEDALDLLSEMEEMSIADKKNNWQIWLTQRQFTDTPSS